MKVCWSVPVLADRPGAGRGDLVRAAALTEGLRGLGHQVRVVEAAGGGGGRGIYRGILRRVLPERLALVLRDLARRVHARRHAREVAGAARRMGADVLVETQVHGVPSGARAARRAGVPLVLDDVSPPDEERALGAGLPGLAERGFRGESAAAAALVVSSEGLRRALAAAGVPEERLAVVSNGVDLAAHRGLDRRAARRSLGVEGRLVVGYAGSFQPWHRVETLVSAVAGIAEDHDVHLLLVGDGPGREEALAAVRRAGLKARVSAPGRVPPERVPELLAACDVGALPGTNDYGQPMKLLEYAAAGLAMVAPDRPPVREVVTGGRTALLFPPGDGRALAGALRRLSAEPGLRESLGQRARREVAGPAGWSGRAEELAAVLRAVRGPTDGERAS